MSYGLTFRPRCAAILLGAGLACLAACKGSEPVVAQVGSHKITLSDFQHEIDAGTVAQESYLATMPGRKELVELLVRRQLVVAEAERAGVDSRPEVRKRIEAVDAEVERKRQDAHERIVIGEYFRTLQEKDLKVTDDEARKFWDSEKEVKCSHILLADGETAAAVKKRLLQGEAFEKVAAEVSQDENTAKKGGDLGFIMKGTLVPEFEKVLFSLKTGEVSDVVPSPYGFHIIRKDAERNLAQAPFDALAPKIRAVLEKQKFQAWVEQAKTRHKIKTNPAALESIKTGTAAAGAGPAGAQTAPKPRRPNKRR